jgi:hypothetical protein
VDARKYIAYAGAILNRGVDDILAGEARHQAGRLAVQMTEKRTVVIGDRRGTGHAMRR